MHAPTGRIPGLGLRVWYLGSGTGIDLTRFRAWTRAVSTLLLCADKFFGTQPQSEHAMSLAQKKTSHDLHCKIVLLGTSWRGQNGRLNSRMSS